MENDDTMVWTIGSAMSFSSSSHPNDCRSSGLVAASLAQTIGKTHEARINAERGPKSKRTPMQVTHHGYAACCDFVDADRQSCRGHR